MRTWTRRAVGGVWMAAIAGTAISACADNESSIFIRQVLVPSGSDCSVTNDPGSMSRGGGLMDLAFAGEYRASLLVGNQLVQRGSADVLRAETARFRIEGAEVRLETTDGDPLERGAFTVPVAGFADPSGGTEPGWGIATVVMVNAATAGALADAYEPGVASPLVGRIVSVVKVFGHTLGGQEIESAEFRYPISFCYGCLVSFPPEANLPGTGAPYCDNPAAEGATINVPCAIGQDDAIDCRLCGSMAICR